MEYAISIIVPIYKAEKYLRKCIDGILQQSFKEFQLKLMMGAQIALGKSVMNMPLRILV